MKEISAVGSCRDNDMKSTLFALIRQAVLQDRFIVSIHAQRRLRERRIMLWQITGSLDDAEVLNERPGDERGPVVETQQALPDGTNVKVVWSYKATESSAALVTVHYFD